MKVLVFGRRSRDEFHPLTTVEMIPDSAIIRDGKPFFIPPTSDSWRYSCGIAIKIGRLGKNISEKFASRYIDGYAPCITTFPENSPGFNALNRCHEGGIILGEWQSPEELPEKFIFHADGCPTALEPDPMLAAKMVALAGRHGVMKIGDIIVMNEDPLAVNLPPDTRITADTESGSNPALSFLVK